MPYHDRAKARLEHEVTLLRHEVASLRSKQNQSRKARQNQAAVQARLEQEIQVLQKELTAIRCDQDKRECGGAEQCSALNQQLEKLDEHVVKQEKYIAFLEEQINHTRTKYQSRMVDVRQNAELVEKELKRVRHEMKTIAEEAAELDSLKKQVGFLGAKVERRDSIISKYEAQQEEMMSVMAGLQKLFDEKKRSKQKPSNHYRVRFREGNIIAPEKPPVPKVKPKTSSVDFHCLSSALKNKINSQEHLTADQ
ncbi:paramyosin [Drosophila takahashii]|uniref:paramyosin n=1 Tax=Drosophila takahashii TaxID=29030 RepID=UPI001CF91694|nr:uncharacterized protein LOC108061658 [Drosophila takahashii]